MLHRRAPLGERAQLRVDGAAFVGRRRLFSVVGQRDHLGLELAQLAGLALVHCAPPTRPDAQERPEVLSVYFAFCSA